MLGSPNFMPPEQASGSRGKVGRHSDVYGLGGILYFLLTAHPPFQGETLETTIHEVLNSEPLSPRALTPSVPRDLETICLKCLEKESAKRYASAQELADELERFLDDEPIRARPVGRVERAWGWCRRKPALATALATAFTLLMVVAIGSPIAAFRIHQRSEVLRRHLYVAAMGNAFQGVKEGNFGKGAASVEKYLHPAPGEEDLRGFEWRYLWQLCQPSEHRIMESAGRRLNCAVFSPDGKTLAVGGHDTNVTVIDVMSKNVLAKLVGFDGYIDLLGITFSPDGQWLAAKGGHVISVWNTENWREQFHWTNGNPNWNMNDSVVISPDSATLAARIDEGIGLWDLSTGTPRFDRTVEWRPSPPGVGYDLGTENFGRVIAYARNGALVATTDWDKLQVRDAQTWNIVTHLIGPRKINRVLSVAFSTNLIAAGYREGELKVWELNTWQEVASFKAHSSYLCALSFSADGTLLASGGSDTVIHVWNVAGLRENGAGSQAGSPYATLKGHARGISSVMFSPAGQSLASASFDGTARLWTVHPNFETRVLAGSDGVPWFSSDGRQVITTTAEGKLYRWNTSARRDPRAINIPPIDTSCFSISSDGGTLATRTSHGAIEVWNLAGCTLAATFQPQERPRGLLLSPDGKLLISSYVRGGIRIRNLATQQERILEHLARCVMSPEGTTLAASRRGSDGIELWSVVEGRQLDLVPVKISESALMAFSWDGRFLAWIGDRNDAKVALAVYDLRPRSRGGNCFST